MPRCFLSAKIPSAAGGNLMSDDDQEPTERRDDNYNLNSDKHFVPMPCWSGAGPLLAMFANPPSTFSRALATKFASPVQCDIFI